MHLIYTYMYIHTHTYTHKATALKYIKRKWTHLKEQRNPEIYLKILALIPYILIKQMGEKLVKNTKRLMA